MGKVRHDTALVYAMVLMAVADSDMSDAELRRIGSIVQHLPAFDDYDQENLVQDAEDCASLLASDEEDGLEKLLELIKVSIPAKMHETAYAVACDVVAADGSATQEELRVLEMLRHSLEIDRLHAAAIERGTRARFMHL